jgi:hypothetical protein
MRDAKKIIRERPSGANTKGHFASLSDISQL